MEFDQDKIRLQIDQGVKKISPQLVPDDYHVTFIPVNDEDGCQIGNDSNEINHKNI